MTAGEWVTLLGYLVGTGVFFWAARISGFDSGAMLRLLTVGLLCGVVGARLAQHVFGGGSWSTLLSTQAGGRTIVAGLLFGWVGVEVAKRVMGLRRSTGAPFALALASGEAVGRIGCHLNECCFGREWNGALSVVQDGVQRFPAQIVSSVWAAVVFVVLLAQRGRVEDAALFRLYVVLFAGGRFFIEFLRESGPMYAGLSAAQWVCLEVVAGMAVIAAVLRTRRAREA